MSKEKSTMMRLPHWIVRRTLACLRCLREHSILSHYLLSMLLREKKKLQDELNQLSRNCLKDVESRSTLYKLIYQDDHFPFPLNSRSIPFFQVFYVCTRWLLRWSSITLPSKSKEEALNLRCLQHCSYVITLGIFQICMIYVQAKSDKL